jgi:trehalose 6-phosphate synthase
MRQQTNRASQRKRPSEMKDETRPHVIIASNRGPVQFFEHKNGRILQRQASGGLVTAFVSLAAQTDLSWVAVASSPLERHVFRDQSYRMVHLGSSKIRVHYVSVPDSAYKQHYNDVSNSMLWFTQHYLLSPDMSPSFGNADQQKWDEGYQVVNSALAAALVETIQALPEEERSRVVVLLQDYHLYLVPGMVRAVLPEVTLSHFIHIPWPAVRYWQFLPQNLVLQILTSLLANDVVGMQTPLDARNFLTCVEELLPEAEIARTPGANTIIWQGRRILVNAYPIGIDPAHVRTLAGSRAAERGYRAISHHFDAQTVLRVDRVEPTKNIVRGLQAFALLLEQHPELRGRVRFVMILVPSREGVRRYRAYARAVFKLVQEINARYAGSDGATVIPIIGNDQARALAAMRSSDVMLVNSVIDGMHLGAKEFAVVNACNGVLVLSRTAGVAHELGETAAFHVTPTNLQETADTLYQALTLNSTERAIMACTARQVVETNPITKWIDRILHDTIMQSIQRMPAYAEPTPVIAR